MSPVVIKGNPMQTPVHLVIFPLRQWCVSSIYFSGLPSKSLTVT